MSNVVNCTMNNMLAVEPPVFTKIETHTTGGLVTIAQRSHLVALRLLMNYTTARGDQLEAGKHAVLVRGDSGLKPWAKAKFLFQGLEFALCPESEVLGFTVLSSGS